MHSPSLIFIPDISGFTDFVKTTEIEHSRHLIGELLEVLIDQNELELKLAEVEGDALFFYKHDAVPSHAGIERQARRMYQAFHKHLVYYDSHRICRCGACTSVSNLRIKFIAHAGGINFVTVKNHTKPHGTPVIAAHRLLKNDVPHQEYLLISDDVLKISPREQSTLNWHNQKQALDVGDVSYHFGEIGEWRKLLHAVPEPAQQGLAKPIMQFELSVNASPEALFELISNFKFRSKLTEGVDDIQFEENKVNRIGSKHICVFGQNTIEFETVGFNFGDGMLVYGERTDDVPGFDFMDTYFVLQQYQNTTKLEARVFGKVTPLGRLIAPIIRRKMGSGLKRQMERLRTMAEEGEDTGR